MDVSVSAHPETSEVTLQVSASARELLPHLRAAAQHLSKERPIKGWRPGKAPVEMAESVFGTERVLHEALDRAVPQLLARAVLARKIEAIGRPSVSVDKASRQAGITFRVRMAVLPRVTLGNLSALTVEAREVMVTDEDVQRELTHLARMQCQYWDVARAAQAEDTVIADWRILIDGAVEESRAATKQPLHLGEDRLIPDFEKGLLGIRAGERREFKIVFPANFMRAAWRGRTATVQVTAHAVQRRVQPEINDAFAKQLGDFVDLAALKYTLKSNLIRDREQQETERRRTILAEQLAELTQFPPLPAVLVDKEVERSTTELRQSLERQQTTLEAYAAGRLWRRCRRKFAGRRCGR